MESKPDNPPGKGKAADPTSPKRPASALEDELNRALDRLDHQVTDTKNYLASLDGQPSAERRRRKGDRKPGHP
jgi:hypothetical protein